jgi:hypothetical protein
MASVSVTTLLQRVEDAVDMENFVSQAALLRWANVLNPRFVAMLGRAGWAPMISSYTITATGATSYTPSSGGNIEMLAVVGVYRQEEDSFTKLRCIDHLQKPGVQVQSDAGYFRVKTLEAGGVSVELYPIPSSGTYIIDYIPVPLVLVTGTPGAGETNTVNYPAGWEEWLVLQLGRKCLTREETVSPAIESELKKVEEEIERMIRDRVYSSAKVRNADSEFEDASDSSTWIWV